MWIIVIQEQTGVCNWLCECQHHTHKWQGPWQQQWTVSHTSQKKLVKHVIEAHHQKCAHAQAHRKQNKTERKPGMQCNEVRWVPSGQWVDGWMVVGTLGVWRDADIHIVCCCTCFICRRPFISFDVFVEFCFGAFNWITHITSYLILSCPILLYLSILTYLVYSLFYCSCVHHELWFFSRKARRIHFPTTSRSVTPHHAIHEIWRAQCHVHRTNACCGAG